jgi:hypothetical protein
MEPVLGFRPKGCENTSRDMDYEFHLAKLRNCVLCNASHLEIGGHNLHSRVILSEAARNEQRSRRIPWNIN